MGKLVEKLHQISQATGSTIGFLGGRASAQKPRPDAILVRVDVTDTAVAEAALANGADALIVVDWAPATGLGAMKSIVGGKGVVWGADLAAASGSQSGLLKELTEAGAAFAVLDASASARLLFEDADKPDRKLDLVGGVEMPSSELGLLLVRAQSLLPVQVGLLRPDIGAREVERMSVGEYARLRLVVESLRFPMLLSLQAAPAEADVATLVHLGIAGVVLPGQAADPQQLGAQIKALRETLEKTPTPKEDRENILISGLMPAAQQPGAPAQPEREPEHE